MKNDDVPFSDLEEILWNCDHVPDEAKYAKIDYEISISYSVCPKVVISEIIYEVKVAGNFTRVESETELHDTETIVSKTEALKSLKDVKCFFVKTDNSREYF